MFTRSSTPRPRGRSKLCQLCRVLFPSQQMLFPQTSWQGSFLNFSLDPRVSRFIRRGVLLALTARFSWGGLAFANDQAIGLQNRFPIVPDDFFVDAGGFASERLILTFRNTTGAALIAFWKVEVNAVA